MGQVIDFESGKLIEEKAEMETKKPTMKEMELRVCQLETIVGQFQGAMQGINSELFQNNANAISLFRALEAKGVIGEEDIKESWQKHIVDPYEKEQDQGETAANDTVATTEDEAVEPTTETPTK